VASGADVMKDGGEEHLSRSVHVYISFPIQKIGSCSFIMVLIILSLTDMEGTQFTLTKL
jgi:hypothetical protein